MKRLKIIFISNVCFIFCIILSDLNLVQRKSLAIQSKRIDCKALFFYTEQDYTVRHSSKSVFHVHHCHYYQLCYSIVLLIFPEYTRTQLIIYLLFCCVFLKKETCITIYKHLFHFSLLLIHTKPEDHSLFRFFRLITSGFAKYSNNLFTYKSSKLKYTIPRADIALESDKTDVACFGVYEI